MDLLNLGMLVAVLVLLIGDCIRNRTMAILEHRIANMLEKLQEEENKDNWWK